jgi:hypothetical protein
MHMSTFELIAIVQSGTGLQDFENETQRMEYLQGAIKSLAKRCDDPIAISALCDLLHQVGACHTGHSLPPGAEELLQTQIAGQLLKSHRCTVSTSALLRASRHSNSPALRQAAQNELDQRADLLAERAHEIVRELRTRHSMIPVRNAA